MRPIAMLPCLIAALLVTAQARSAAPAGPAALDLLGRYALADGRMLEVERIGRQMWVLLDGRELALSPAAPDSQTRWRSADGSLALEFRAAGDGSVSGVTLRQRRALR